MKQQLLTLLIALMASSGLMSAKTYSGTCGDNLTWTLTTEDGVLTISGEGEMADYSSYSFVPWYSYRTSITAVIIPNSMTSIGNYAFYGCNNITSVNIGNKTETIGNYAFNGCSSLTSVTIPNSVTFIGEWAFSWCRNLTAVIIPNSVTSIGKNAFYQCSGLTSIAIPNGVKSIGYQIFCYCSNLISVIIPNSVTSIEESAFSQCSSLTTITIPNSVTSIGWGVFSGCSDLTSITIPNSVNSIGANAFSGCSGLISVTIGNSVKNIREKTFYNCSSLTSVTIGNGVTSISESAFYNCSGLASITCEAVTPPTLVGNAFYNVDKTIPLYVPSESVEDYKFYDGWKYFTNIQPIPTGTSSGIGKFSVSATQQVTFSPGNLQYNAAQGTHQCADGTPQQGTWRFAPNQWDYVGNDNKNISSTYNGWIDLFGWATSGWYSGAYAYRPWSTSTSYSDYYPGGGSSNNYVNTDWGVYNQIGNDAPGTWRTMTASEWLYLFHGRDNAANLFGLGTLNGVNGTIILPDDWQAPDGVTFITSAENGLSWQGSYYLQDGSNHYNDNAFVSGPFGTWDAMATSGAVFLPASGYRYGISIYDAGTGGYYWSSPAYDSDFAYNLRFLSNYLNPQSNYDRNDGFAVRLVSDLTTSSDPEPCILASGTCGAEGDNLTWELSCDGALTISGIGAMADYDYLEETRAPWYDSYRTKIVTVVIEEGITSIGDYAFNDCENLTAINIPNTVTSIGESAFHHCLSLGDINVPRSVSLIKRGAFRHCPDINISVDEDNQYYTIENGVLFNKEKTLLHTYPMSKHEATYSIPNTVTDIEDLAFYYADITSVDIPEGVLSIGVMSFYICGYLTSITIPNSVTTIGGAAFYSAQRAKFLHLGQGLTSIGQSAFGYMPVIEYIISEAPNPPVLLDNDAFVSVDKSIPLYVPCEAKEAYKEADGWKEFTNVQAIPGQEPCAEPCITASGTCGAEGDGTNLTWQLSCEGVLTISGYDLWGDISEPWSLYSNQITSVIITGSVGNMPDNAFASYNNLTSVRIDGDVEIGNYAFSGCNNLTSVEFKGNVDIGDYAFSGCNSLPFVEIIDEDICYYDYSDEPCYYEHYFKIIGEGAFSGCTGLKNVTISSSFGIGHNAFNDCTSLISADITCASISGFSNCTSLKDVSLYVREFEWACPTVADVCENVSDFDPDEDRASFPGIDKHVFSGSPCSIHVSCDMAPSYELALEAFGRVEMCSPCLYGSGNCGAESDNLKWEISCDARLTVSGTGDISPNEWDTFRYPWTKFGNMNSCSFVESVVIGEGVTSIGTSAFGEVYNLYDVSLPSTLISIGDNNFSDCSGIQHVTIPHSVTSIGNRFCTNSRVMYVTFESEIPPTIGKDCFLYGDRDWTDSYYGYVYDYPYYGDDYENYNPGEPLFFVPCGSKDAYVTALNVDPRRVIEGTYESSRFYYSISSNNESQGIVTITKEPTSCNDMTLSFRADANDGYVFKQWSDGNTDNPRTLTLTQDITLTAEFESAACEIVASGTCGDNLTWELDCHGVLTISGTGAMDKWKTYSYVPWKDYAASITSVILPDGLTNIGLGAFYGCTGLTAIEIPNSVTSIGYQACCGCYSLVSVAMSSNVTSIGEYAFKNCSALTAIDIPEGVAAIEKQAFFSCSRLTSVVIPNSAQYIGDLAFFNCADLATVTFGENIGEVRYQAFYGCISLTDAHLPNSVTAIGGEVFSGCTALKTVTMSDNVTTIGAKTFYKCNNLVSVALSRGLTEIADATFFNCEALKDVTVPATVTAIGESAFQYCATLASVTIPKGVTTVGKYAFHSCTNMTSATFKCAVPEFGSAPFGGGNNCIFYVPCGSKEAYMAALNVKDSRVEETILPDYSVTSTDLTQGTVTVTHAPANCEDLTLSFRADASKSYEFVSWSDGNTDNPRSLTLTQDTVLTAVFAPIAQCSIETTDGITIDEDDLPYMWESKIFDKAGTQTTTLKSMDGCDSIVTFTLRVRYNNIVLQENESSEYYDNFAEDYNGRTVNTATLNRQFTQGRWATLCLPFNVNKAMMMSLGLYNRVFAFRYAQQLDDETIQVFFVPAQSIEAGKGYIVNPNAKLAAKTSFVFPNVTINTDSDNGDITALTGYNDGTGRGNLFLVGTLRTGMLQGSTTGNTYLGLKDNQLYYPNSTSGTLMRAYRAVFRSGTPINAQRVRIIAEGESVTELEVIGEEQGRMDNGQLQNNATPARKYLRNGLLFIERNGITYTAQGQRLD